MWSFRGHCSTGAGPIAAATNADGTVYLRFVLPTSGLGLGLGVQISVLQGAGNALMAQTNLTAATAFSYLDPAISNVIVTRALFSNATNVTGDYVRCPFGVGTSTWPASACSDSTVVQYTISGSNFGADPTSTSVADGVLRTLQMMTGNYTCPAGQIYVLQPVASPLGCMPVSSGLPGVLGEQWATAGDASGELYLYS